MASGREYILFLNIENTANTLQVTVQIKNTINKSQIAIR